MAWITPVTDRLDASTQTTHDDMNRITGNLNFLGADNLKANYVESDIVVELEWTKAVNHANFIADELGEAHATALTDFANLNYIESLCLHYKEGSLFPHVTLYPNNEQYPNKRRT